MKNVKDKIIEEQIQDLVSNGKIGKHLIASNLYLHVKDINKAHWYFRRSWKKKRVERKFAVYGENNPYFMDYMQALAHVNELQTGFSAGKNPFKSDHALIRTFDDLVQSYWSRTKCEYTKPKQIYLKDIGPAIGDTAITDLTRIDLENVVIDIVESDRLSVAELTISLFKKAIGYACTHKLLMENIAYELNIDFFLDKANRKKKKTRRLALTEKKIGKFFHTVQQFPEQAPLRSQIAIALYMIFGFRKNELLRAKWEDFDPEDRELTVRPTKVGEFDELTVKVLPLLNYLKAQSKGSDYLFPAALNSKTPYLSDGALNKMINKFYGKHRRFHNPLGKAGVPRFTIHDLRRTFTTMGSEEGFKKEVTDRALNHFKEKDERAYNLGRQFKARTKLYKKLADIILPISNLLEQIPEEELDLPMAA
ncbi:tyrosine-type recombinase/integrase [Thalassotalea ganghwensis]